MAYVASLRCPVCGEEMDRIERPGQREGDYGTALLGNDGRREHAEKSPQCAQHENWIHGWDRVELGWQGPRADAQELKYIIVKDRSDQSERAVVFPKQLVHAGVLRSIDGRFYGAVSAGFCKLTTPVEVWGGSETMDLASRPGDAAILDRDLMAQPDVQAESFRWNARSQSQCEFSARLWLCDAEGLIEIETWVQEFEPTDNQRRGSAEWAAEHLRESYGVDELYELFGLEKDKPHQVLCRGRLRGYWYNTPEMQDYDEELTILEYKSQVIPEDYFQWRFVDIPNQAIAEEQVPPSLANLSWYQLEVLPAEAGFARKFMILTDRQVSQDLLQIAGLVLDDGIAPQEKQQLLATATSYVSTEEVR